MNDVLDFCDWFRYWCTRIHVFCFVRLLFGASAIIQQRQHKQSHQLQQQLIEYNCLYTNRSLNRSVAAVSSCDTQAFVMCAWREVIWTKKKTKQNENRKQNKNNGQKSDKFVMRKKYANNCWYQQCDCDQKCIFLNHPCDIARTVCYWYCLFVDETTEMRNVGRFVEGKFTDFILYYK